MRKGLWMLMVLMCLAGLAGGMILAQPADGPAGDPNPPAVMAPVQPESTRLAVVWSSGDPDVAHRVCLMYTQAAAKNKWFDEVRLVVWGPSARLLAGDKDLQAKVRGMIEGGMKVQACVVCADSYGVSARLREMGIEVLGMGKPLSDYLQSGWKVLTF